MKTMGEFLEHFRTQRKATRKLVATIPEEQFSWAPSPNAFACGDLVRHMMQAEIFWRRLIVAAARGEPFDPFNLPGSSGERLAAFRPSNLESSRSEKFGSSVADCLARWAEIQARTEHELSSLAPEAFEAPVTHPLATLHGPVWEACLGMIEHEIHHRGQLSAYLKMMMVEQPASLID